MNTLYMYKQLKNGKWRLYKIVLQPVTTWRGTNGKTTTVREERCSQDNYGEIINFDSKEEAIEYCKEVLGKN